MPRKPAASQAGTPRCVSQVAAVWRKVCGVTLPLSSASSTALLKPAGGREPWLSEETGVAENRRRERCAGRHLALRLGAVRLRHHGLQAPRGRSRYGVEEDAVSYTHLTLPTNREV